MSLNALALPRHECTSCGACCNNVRVRFVDAAEQARIAGFADQMGIDGCVDAERILHRDGNCPFQEDGWRCRIHAEHGLAAKPTMCQTYPLVLVQTESGVRVGVDPSSRAFRTTRKSGPELALREIAMPTVELSAAQVGLERQLIEQTVAPGATLGHVVAALCGCPGPAAGGLPDEVAERMVHFLKGSSLAELLAEAQCGPHNRAALTPLVQWLRTVDSAALPAWRLGAEEDAYARESLQATLYLRLAAPSYPSVHAAAFLVVLGQVCSGYAVPEPASFGSAVSAWLRLTRSRYFWQRLVPRPEQMVWLATGVGERPD